MSTEIGAASGAALAAKSGAFAIAGTTAVTVAVALASVIVMVIKRPRTVGEWTVALISTVMSSLGGGAAAVLYLGLHTRLQSPDAVEVYISLVAVGSLIFAAGLPGWVLVRVAFNTMAKFQDRSADDIYHDAKELLP